MDNLMPHKNFVKPICLTMLIVLVVFICNAQTLNIHSVADDRQPFGDHGYTLDGGRMISARKKLLNDSNFSPIGTYPKQVKIHDEYATTGTLVSIKEIPFDDVLFFGTFFTTTNATLATFTQSEIDSLYKWSKRGGKMIIAAGSNSWNLDVLDEKWGFSVKQESPSYFIPTNEGNNTLLFDGPFGMVQLAKQGAGAQGYFKKIPDAVIILATDSSERPTIYLDCSTLDLVLADVDGFTHYNLTNGSSIQNQNDRLWANLFVYMDNLEEPNKIILQNEQLSAIGGSEFQWQLNGNPIEGGNNQSFTPTEEGIYSLLSTHSSGCRMVSENFKFEFDQDFVLTLPNVIHPNGDGVNDLFEPIEALRVNITSMIIYNRWGNKIFSSKTVGSTWDGNNSDGVKMTSGTYYYSLGYISVSGESGEAHGFVTLIR